MLKPRRISASHRDAFLERYEGLHAWAVQMTANDRALAEDLLHDLFILFTLSQPDLRRIENLDNYLYASLRNLHISQLRRATRRRFEQLSVVEYESARLSLHSIAHGRDLIQAQDELRRICHYACARKETANAASVLILRFFHGYYPTEIAKVIRSTRPAVDKRLLAARVEAKAFLENSLEKSQTLAFLHGPSKPANPEVFPAKFARTPGDFLLELQELIFHSRPGECLNSEQLKHLYESAHVAPIARKHLAHIVSCPTCLDAANALLGLPLLNERYPTDTMDKDNKKGGGPGDGGDKGGAVRKITDWEREAREAFEHKPQELCVSVNGYLLGSQLIGSELSELTLNVATDERINFCEVFSEQGIRLMMVNVEELPPNGPGELRQRVNLSEARTLETQLLFSNPFPTLHVTYHDPALAIEAVTDGEVSESGEIANAPTPQEKRIKRLRLSSPIKKLDKPISRVAKAFRERLLNLQFWLKPATVTAIIAVGLIAAVSILERRQPVPPPFTAADLLQRSALAEDAPAANRNQVLHRTIGLEERRVDGDVLARRRVEVWQSAANGTSARRLFDEKGSLVAGDWRRADGVRTVYSHASRPRLKQVPDAKPGVAPLLGFDNAWQFLPSAKDFALLTGGAGKVRIEERPSDYLITYSRDGSPDNANGVLKASLVLSRADIHASEQTLTVRQGDDVREFRMVELRYEWHSPDAVEPSVFEPDVELTGSATHAKTERTPAAPGNNSATLETEVEVVKLLDSVNAFSGERISVTRVNEQLKVAGIVDSASRKAEVLAALAPVRAGRGVLIEIETTEEAASRKKAGQTTGNISIESVNVATDQSYPVETELRALLAKRGVPTEKIDQEMRQFVTEVTASSRVLRRNALALKQIAQRFTPAEIERLEPSKREEWKALVRSRARAVAGDVRALASQLGAVFPGLSSPPAGGGVGTASVDGVVGAAQRLFGLAAACDSQVSQSFAISSSGQGAAPVKSVQFWRSLAQMASLAAELQKF